MRRSWIVLTLLIGCSDYDLHRPDDVVLTDDEYEEPEPEVPSEDPDILVEPMSLDFGSVLKNCVSSAQAVTVTNKGKAPLEVSAIELVGDGKSAFAIYDGEPVTLAQDESMEFTVAFTPNLVFDYDLDIAITSNDPEDAVVLVDTLGTGSQSSLYEEDFIQEYNEQVDVLWVVDNSGSMSDEVARIATNFNAFIDEFINLNIDYHIAVITTDMDDPTDSGRFQGPIIDKSTANPREMFTQQTNQGTMGSATEKGFDAVQAALSSPLAATVNAGFLREEAALSVIVVSDEDDSGNISAADFTNFLFSLKDDPNMVRFNGFFSVTGLNPLFEMFEFFDRFFDLFEKYPIVVENTGGFIESIQASDFSLALQELSFAAVGMTITFYLEKEPDSLSDITVEVDGVEVPYSEVDGWTYDEETNAVTFHGEAIPGPDARIDIQYVPVGSCN